MIREGFAVIGCPRCRRMQVADLTHTTKTCICGHKIDLTKVKLLAVSRSADEAGSLLRSITSEKHRISVCCKYVQLNICGKINKKRY